MKKILFMTDFCRTVTPDGIITMKEYEDNIDTLLFSLTKIKEHYNANGIIFSISTNIREYSYIEQFINIVKRKTFNKKDFEIGNIFLREKVIRNINGIEEHIENLEDDKGNQLLNYIKELKNNNIELVWVGFADDKKAESVSITLEEINIPYNTFKPGTSYLNTNKMFTSKLSGIQGLNESIASYLK